MTTHAPLETLSHTLARLAKAVEANPENLSHPAHRQMLDQAASHLMTTASMIESQARVADGSADSQAEEDTMTPDDALLSGVGYKTISAIGMANLHSHFNASDIDDTEALSGTQIKRMMLSLGLYTNQEDLDVIMGVMDDHKTDEHEVGDGTFAWPEFAEGMNTLITGHFDNDSVVNLPSRPLERLLNVPSKVGYGGTSWRKQANTLWILTCCAVIMVTALFIIFTIYFRYILVPLTMAYFLTFVLGPIIDFFTQRPLICLGRVFCRIKKLDEAAARVQWEKQYPRRALPHVTDPEYPFDRAWGRWCHAVPPASASENASQLLTVGKLPFPLALLATFALIATVFYMVFVFISHDIRIMVADEIFMSKVRGEAERGLQYLREEQMVALEKRVVVRHP